MKKIRVGAYETNSSSSHSLTIDATSFLMDTILPEDGVVTIRPEDFGWQWKRFNDAATKASYCLTGTLYVSNRKEEALSNLRSVIQAHTMCDEVRLLDPSDGYIDHESVENGEMYDLLFDMEKLHNFIFNTNSWLFLGNDNSRPPNKFYDITNQAYRWKITFPDYPSITHWEFTDYPCDEEILEAITSMDLRFTKWGSHYKPEERPGYWSSSDEYFELSRDSEVSDTTISFFSNKDTGATMLLKYELVEIENDSVP